MKHRCQTFYVEKLNAQTATRSADHQRARFPSRPCSDRPRSIIIRQTLHLGLDHPSSLDLESISPPRAQFATMPMQPKRAIDISGLDSVHA
ncbi:hypothetical protein HBI56_115680 [Parastagonospora nodorum]|uniref:Uncharacterized protein n=1 Tax=Phaeosphaeria nodorum (strain SN15 / ATCC MYA-4574 / FGSC 10173) TaxID=321614 RepID=A0A7U2I3P1_PHANO|nr:hypothetical protein HBH56_196540 [Parastagonospora nodorum]QRD00620.1 hypothetical protein JI435_306460 [Parastagonospora nodorum SN15]KAH3924846.1 hypothetical protein HBH54_186950 [Parastagonospora nodorum]KAH3952982.1 hypothetical protein HBH53_039090 [Parastagonospora nodorum]KAH3976488.1 hypothetical protein HBH52_119390 [Parastagonospora nodorum]